MLLHAAVSHTALAPDLGALPEQAFSSLLDYNPEPVSCLLYDSHPCFTRKKEEMRLGRETKNSYAHASFLPII